MKNELLKAALKYRDMGFSVIPIKQTDKKPFIKWLDYQSKIATPEEITTWWTDHPYAMIGIVTGKISNLFVIDFDKYNQDFKQEIADQYFPDSLITPSVQTQNNGLHLYFKYPEGLNGELTVRSRILPAIDYRGNGGYVIAPPSDNGAGKTYQWLLNLNETSLADLPIAFLKALINNNTIYRNVTNAENCNKNDKSLLQSVTFTFKDGNRDDSLFHVANVMTKGGSNKEEILMVLERLAKCCEPPFEEKEIVTKCNSALERAARKERHLAKEVEDFVLLQNGYFSVTDCYHELQIVTKKDKTAARVALSRLKDKTIEKYGAKDGVYKRIEHDIEFVKFDVDEKPEVEFPINLPLGLNDIIEISQANIILVAGEFNAGKTTFVLNVLKENKGKIPIRYIFSEGGKSELKKRFYTFGLPFSFWIQDEMTEYVKRSGDFHTVIRPDAINIIDYLEFKDSEYNRGAEYLTKIQDKLTTGIAIIAIQKKEGVRMPRSGDMIVEKPRLALSFSKLLSGIDNPQGICEILKGKAPKIGRIDGKKYHFEITDRGSRFRLLKDWGYWR
jgi:hypothetical protein